VNRDPDSEVVQRAYQNSIPIMAELMFNPKHNPVDAVESLSTWLHANKSIDRKFDPACAPIPQMPEPAL
jgi:endo-beta-N-acetylglucosaminidase D